jgi:hypothetical protein
MADPQAQERIIWEMDAMAMNDAAYLAHRSGGFSMCAGISSRVDAHAEVFAARFARTPSGWISRNCHIQVTPYEAIRSAASSVSRGDAGGRVMADLCRYMAHPGDVAVAILGDGANRTVAALRQQMGLNDPGGVQYGRWAHDLVRGDLNRSLFLANKSVKETDW